MQLKFVAILLLNVSQFIKGDQSLQCGDWEAYKDEKCFKFYDNKMVQYYDDAKNTCYQNEASSLVSITSRDEQDFLFNLLVNVHKFTNGIWIGGQYKERVFKWSDNSPVNFTNWAENNPRNNSGYECVHMSLIEPYNGEWMNGPCNESHLAVCQKSQNWLFSYLQQTVMELRQSLNESKTELQKTKAELQNEILKCKQNTELELDTIKSQINKSTPPGTIAYFTNTTTPSGWLKANGQSVSRKEYIKLYETIGTTFGSGDGSTTFTLPDLRGEFIRGWSDGRDVDKNRAFSSLQVGSFIPFGGGINNSWGAGSFAHHNRYGWLAGSTFDDGFDDGILPGVTSHGVTYPNESNLQEMYYALTPNKGYITAWLALRGTRPRNVALLACIKH